MKRAKLAMTAVLLAAITFPVPVRAQAMSDELVRTYPTNITQFQPTASNKKHRKARIIAGVCAGLVGLALITHGAYPLCWFVHCD